MKLEGGGAAERASEGVSKRVSERVRESVRDGPGTRVTLHRLRSYIKLFICAVRVCLSHEHQH